MPWFKVDDGFANSEPVMRVPRRYRASVIGLWTLSGTWCAKELTDGRVPAHMIDELAGTTAQASWLVTAGLWSETPEGYVFIGWEKYQPTRAEVEAARHREAERKRKYRESHRDTNGTGGGHDAGHQAESEHPDPTRPDPTSSTKKRTTPASRGTRMFAGWLPPSDEIARAKSEYAPHVDLKAENEVFVDYWISAAGVRGVKADWVATWRNWMKRKEADSKVAKRSKGDQIVDVLEQGRMLLEQDQRKALE